MDWEMLPCLGSREKAGWTGAGVVPQQASGRRGWVIDRPSRGFGPGERRAYPDSDGRVPDTIGPGSERILLRLRLSVNQTQALNTEAQIKDLHDYLAKSIGLLGVISLQRQFSR